MHSDSAAHVGSLADIKNHRLQRKNQSRLHQTRVDETPRCYRPLPQPIQWCAPFVRQPDGTVQLPPATQAPKQAPSLSHAPRAEKDSTGAQAAAHRTHSDPASCELVILGRVAFLCPTSTTVLLKTPRACRGAGSGNTASSVLVLRLAGSPMALVAHTVQTQHTRQRWGADPPLPPEDTALRPLLCTHGCSVRVDPTIVELCEALTRGTAAWQVSRQPSHRGNAATRRAAVRWPVSLPLRCARACSVVIMMPSSASKRTRPRNAILQNSEGDRKVVRRFSRLQKTKWVMIRIVIRVIPTFGVRSATDELRTVCRV